MDSAQWRAYGRTIETVSISFDGCKVDMGEGLQCLLIKVLEYSCNVSRTLETCSFSSSCLAGILPAPAIVYFHPQHLRIMLELKSIGIVKFQLSTFSSASVVQELSSCQYLATQKCSKESL